VTTSPRTTRRSLPQRVTDVEHDLQGHRLENERLRSVQDSRFGAEIASIRERLGAHSVLQEQTDQRHDRLVAVVTLLGERLSNDHDSIVAELTPRLTYLEELVENGMQLNLAASITGFTDDEIREILSVQQDEELSDSAMVTGLVNQIGSLKAQLSAVVDTLAETRGMVNDHTEQLRQHGTALAGVAMCTNALEDTLGETRTEFTMFATNTNTRLDAVESGSKLPKWGLPTAIVAGIIAAIFFNGIKWRDTVPVQVGNSVGSGTLRYHVLDSGWTALFFGVLVAFMVLFVASLFSKSSTAQTTTVRQQITNVRQRRNNRNTGANQPQGNPQPAPTQTLPAQPERVPAA
jgi:DNA-binding transcriptional MerR regulator